MLSNPKSCPLSSPMRELVVVVMTGRWDGRMGDVALDREEMLSQAMLALLMRAQIQGVPSTSGKEADCIVVTSIGPAPRLPGFQSTHYQCDLEQDT